MRAKSAVVTSWRSSSSAKRTMSYRSFSFSQSAKTSRASRCRTVPMDEPPSEPRQEYACGVGTMKGSDDSVGKSWIRALSPGRYEASANSPHAPIAHLRP